MAKRLAEDSKSERIERHELRRELLDLVHLGVVLKRGSDDSGPELVVRARAADQQRRV